MNLKKITVIISYNYDKQHTASNTKIAERMKHFLAKGCDPRHEKIQSVIAEDY